MCGSVIPSHENIMDGVCGEEKRVIWLSIIDFFDAQQQRSSAARGLA
jgi:hypothetical protein